MATSKTMPCVGGSRQEDGERGCLGRKRCCFGTGKENREQVITHKVKVRREILIDMQEGEWGIKLSVSRASLDQTGLELGPRASWVQLVGGGAWPTLLPLSPAPSLRCASPPQLRASPPGSRFSSPLLHTCLQNLLVGQLESFFQHPALARLPPSLRQEALSRCPLL